MMPDKYTEDYVIPGYFIDCNHRLKASSFFDIAQELAVRGSTQLGLPDLARAHTRWLLSILPLYPLGFWDPSQGLKHEG